MSQLRDAVDFVVTEVVEVRGDGVPFWAEGAADGPPEVGCLDENAALVGRSLGGSAGPTAWGFGVLVVDSKDGGAFGSVDTVDLTNPEDLYRTIEGMRQMFGPDRWEAIDNWAAALVADMERIGAEYREYVKQHKPEDGEIERYSDYFRRVAMERA